MTADAVQTQINQYWSDRAGAYNAHHVDQISNDLIRDAWIAAWNRVLPAPPARVLDVGTGTGHVSLLLAELGYDVVGIDLAEGMLEHARAKAADLERPPELRVGDAVVPDVGSGSLDVLTSRYVLWTLRTPELALRNWRTLLRPGGLLAAVDSTWFPEGLRPGDAGDAGMPEERPSGFVEMYDERVVAALPLAESSTIEDTAAMMRDAGFADVTVTPLAEIRDLDRRFGVAPGHEVRLQFMITGRA